ncbi:hypothetical protein [Pararhodobacter sp. SW119]|uniref:hypothetical protein n=1 Tax=Pararhodobacter sp. SW119 TaxID=2780075 RepID=UPI001ADFB279|nr:hypothetical protein [Pararhodobacter sp. SW119]
MTKTSTSKKTGGRPPHYTLEQVSDVIGKLVAEGMAPEEINAATVKIRLCADHGVSDGIRDEALGQVVANLLEARAEDERRALLKSLPPSVAPAVDDVVASIKKELLLLVARQNATCMSAAEAECEALRAEKRIAYCRIATLEVKVREQGSDLATISTERDAALADLTAVREDLLAAQLELEHRGRDVSAVDKLITELRSPAVR